MQLDAPLCQLHRECCRMGALLRAPLNCLIRNEPRIPPAAPVLSASVIPARDVALVRVRNAEREPIDRRPAFRREMKNVFVAIVQITRRADRLEMAARSR